MFDFLRRAAERRRLVSTLPALAAEDRSGSHPDGCRCPKHRTGMSFAEYAGAGDRREGPIRQRWVERPVPAVVTVDVLEQLVPATREVWQYPVEDPLVAYLRRCMAARDREKAARDLAMRRDEEVAYRSGAYIAGPEADLHGHDGQAHALRLAADYLREDPGVTGARLAAMVLAGYTGTPREAVK